MISHASAPSWSVPVAVEAVSLQVQRELREDNRATSALLKTREAKRGILRHLGVMTVTVTLQEWQGPVPATPDTSQPGRSLCSIRAAPGMHTSLLAWPRPGGGPREDMHV